MKMLKTHNLAMIYKSSCQSYNDTFPFFFFLQSVTLIVNGVSPYISHITKCTGLRSVIMLYLHIFSSKNGSCFEIDQEMDAILLIIGIVYSLKNRH
jgi:hypothetical protein